MLIANGDAVLLANFLVGDDPLVFAARILSHFGYLSLVNRFVALWVPDRLSEDLYSPCLRVVPGRESLGFGFFSGTTPDSILVQEWRYSADELQHWLDSHHYVGLQLNVLTQRGVCRERI